MKQIDGLVTKDEMYRLISGFRTRFKISEEAGHEMAKRVAEMPTIEAEPVKYGRWEVNGDRFYPFCSNCKYEPPKELIRCNALSLEPILTKYCPNCGSENGTKIYKGRDNIMKEKYELEKGDSDD